MSGAPPSQDSQIGLFQGAPRSLPVARACLVVLNGFGLADPSPGNAISLAATPTFDLLWARCPHTTLRTCGTDVGLPAGQMGNSEVGHLNLGAGAIVKQDLLRIDEAVAAHLLTANETLVEAFQGAQRVHLLGLVSDGGVHSSLAHLLALLSAAQKLAPQAQILLHAFTDGRDTLPHSGEAFLRQLDELPGFFCDYRVNRRKNSNVLHGQHLWYISINYLFYHAFVHIFLYRILFLDVHQFGKAKAFYEVIK
jgi:hypothetical protein